MKLSVFILAVVIMSVPALAEARRKPSVGNPRFESGRGNGPFVCDNGRTYELRGNVILVDGIPALNRVYYEFDGPSDGSPELSLLENGFTTATCRLLNPPPPAPRSKQWDNYVKVCDPDCHWETREIR